MQEQVSQKEPRCRYIQMNTTHIQLFFNISFSCSLQTYINMQSTILVLCALRLYKDNWLCTNFVLLPNRNQVFSRPLILVLLTEGFYHMKFELTTHGYSAPHLF